jgi:hypothetical protein
VVGAFEESVKKYPLTRWARPIEIAHHFRFDEIAAK